jgi:hypothetical protein
MYANVLEYRTSSLSLSRPRSFGWGCGVFAEAGLIFMLSS